MSVLGVYVFFRKITFIKIKKRQLNKKREKRRAAAFFFSAPQGKLVGIKQRPRPLSQKRGALLMRLGHFYRGKLSGWSRKSVVGLRRRGLR